MSLDGDQYLDRRRLKRRLTFWRVLGVVAVAVAIIAAVGRFDPLERGDRVARISVNGLILSDKARDKVLKDLADDAQVKALIVDIDSPGGTFVGGESLYQGLRDVAEKKPVVAVMGGTATSAGYMIALGADQIIARAGSLTGSIGVIMQTVDITQLLEKLGVRPEIIKSGPLKAQPNPFEPFTADARRATEAVVQDFFNMFVDMVVERRGMDHERVMALADGRVFSGRQAKENGLVDVIGAEPEARKWLTETHDIKADLPIKDVEVHHDDEPWRDMIRGLAGKTLFSERLRLDGVISLWHPKAY
jgi:protease-4